MILELIKKCRSYRRFDSKKKISDEELRSFVQSARFVPSAGNLQRLRFACFTDEGACNTLFSALRFAAYLKDWSGPSECERPVAYIVIASEKDIDTNLAIDLGIAAEAILLTAAEAGVGGCIFRSYDPGIISPLMPSPEFKIHSVIALGYPSETVVTEDCQNGDIKYYRDSEDRHVVPKLPLDILIM